MMNKKRMVFSAFGVILLFLIAACDSGQKDTGGAPKTPFLGGTDGVQIKFLEGNPPTEVTDKNSFPFQAVIGIKNNGETDIAAAGAIISLGGFLPSTFRSADADFLDSDLTKKSTEALNGRYRDSEGNVIESVETFISFPKDGKQFNFKGEVAGNSPSSGDFKASVCYKYRTKAVSELCVLQNQIEAAKNSICIPGEAKPIFSSSSPIQVNSFRQNAVGRDKIQFSFDIVHAGQGQVFDFSSTAADCPTDPREPEKRLKEDSVKVTIKTGIGSVDQLKCVGLTTSKSADGTVSASGSVKLINGKRPVTCAQDLPSPRTEFRKPIDIIVDFNYLSSTTTQVLVKHLIS